MAKYKFEETRRVVELDEGEYLSIGRLNPLRGLYEDFFIINQKFLKYIVLKNLTGRQSKILFYLLSEMKQDNRIITNGRIIAEALNIQHTNVLKDIKILEDYKIIYRRKLGMWQTEIGINYDVIEHDIVNPMLGYKGPANTEKIAAHKTKIDALTPFGISKNLKEGIRQYYDKETGEVFHTDKIPRRYMEELPEDIKPIENFEKSKKSKQ